MQHVGPDADSAPTSPRRMDERPDVVVLQGSPLARVIDTMARVDRPPEPLPPTTQEAPCFSTIWSGATRSA